jgi:hypothetical protein
MPEHETQARAPAAVHGLMPRSSSSVFLLRFACFFVCFAIVAAASPCAAQEISLSGPLAGACPAVLARYWVPARVEWGTWVTSGVTGLVSAGTASASAFVGAGVEATAGVVDYRGFPAPRVGLHSAFAPREDRAELRLGPWAAAETRSVGAVVEAGVTAHLGTTGDLIQVLFLAAPAGMFDLRLGGGYGAFVDRGRGDGRSGHVTLALGWGARVVFARHTWGGACDPAPPPALFADATLVRLVATVRRAIDVPATEVLLGIELSPTWALAPMRAQRRPMRPDLAPGDPR